MSVRRLSCMSSRPVLDPTDVVSTIRGEERVDRFAFARRTIVLAGPSALTPPLTALRYDKRQERLASVAAWTVRGHEVAVSYEAGNYYCEHVYLCAQVAATSVRLNDSGEPLVGFLHTPAGIDAPSGLAATSEVVSRAIAGYVAECVDVSDTRVLLTGFGPEAYNYTGEWVSSPTRLDEAMTLAFGAYTVTEMDGARRYALPDGRTVTLMTRVLAPDDSAIDGGVASIQNAIEEALPHAIIALGLGCDGAFRAEARADDGGLSFDGTTLRHVSGVEPTRRAAYNYSLARALGARVD